MSMEKPKITHFIQFDGSFESMQNIGNTIAHYPLMKIVSTYFGGESMQVYENEAKNEFKQGDYLVVYSSGKSKIMTEFEFKTKVQC